MLTASEGKKWPLPISVSFHSQPNGSRPFIARLLLLMAPYQPRPRSGPGPSESESR